MKLPEEIIKMYVITETEDCVSFHHPAYVAVYKDERFYIEERDCVFDISNSKCSVGVWKETERLHITVFR